MSARLCTLGISHSSSALPTFDWILKQPLQKQSYPFEHGQIEPGSNLCWLRPMVTKQSTPGQKLRLLLVVHSSSDTLSVKPRCATTKVISDSRTKGVVS